MEYYQTYASGPMSEVDSIVWPNPEFDNNITVHGPEVKALVQRYLTQMIRELRALPDPERRRLAAEGRGSRRAPPGQQDHGHSLRQGRRSSARAALLQHRAGGQHVLGIIPLAIYDAVAEGVIDRPMRIFAPGFGAGAVGGYVVLRLDPAIVARS